VHNPSAGLSSRIVRTAGPDQRSDDREFLSHNGCTSPGIVLIAGTLTGQQTGVFLKSPHPVQQATSRPAHFFYFFADRMNKIINLTPIQIFICFYQTG